MGVDISGWIEVPSRGNVGGWDGVIRIRRLVERDYGVFGSLFGIRNEDEFVPAFAARGLPSDLSREARDDLQDDLGELAVGETWALWSEIKSLDWTERGAVEVAHSLPLSLGSQSDEYEYTEWREEAEAGRWHACRRRKDVADAEWEDVYQDKREAASLVYQGGNVVRWPPPIYQEKRWSRGEVLALTTGWKLLLKLMEDLAETFGEESVRLVVWFDSE